MIRELCVQLPALRGTHGLVELIMQKTLIVFIPSRIHHSNEVPGKTEDCWLA
jgi:hypothetical protein